jgi:hypothetical protein
MDVPLEPGKDGRVRSHWPLRSEPDEVMSAKQLADACLEARTEEDRKYALGEVASFLSGLGAEADTQALMALLRLPADEDSERLLVDVERKLADRAPAIVGALLRVVVEGDHPACDNAAAALDQAFVADLAQGLIEVLEDDNTHAGMKRAAAAGLISLGPSAADQIADVLADPEIRDWVTEAAGCPLDATGDEVMEAIAESDNAHPTAGAAGGEVAGDLEESHQAGAAADAGGEVDAWNEASVEGDDDDPGSDDGLVDVDGGADAADAGAGDDEKLDDVVDSAVDDAEEEEGGSEPADAGDPGADLERDFAAFENDFRAFDEGLKRGPSTD